MAPTKISLRQMATTPLSSFAPAWTSGNLTWTAGTAQTVNHTLGRIPHMARVAYVCIAAHTVNGVPYSVGDEIHESFVLDSSNNPYNAAIQRISSVAVRFVPNQIGTFIGAGYPSASWRVRVDLW